MGTERTRRHAASYAAAWFIDGATHTRDDLFRLFVEAMTIAREEGRQEERERVIGVCSVWMGTAAATKVLTPRVSQEAEK